MYFNFKYKLRSKFIIKRALLLQDVTLVMSCAKTGKLVCQVRLCSKNCWLNSSVLFLNKNRIHPDITDGLFGQCYTDAESELVKPLIIEQPLDEFQVFPTFFFPLL